MNPAPPETFIAAYDSQGKLNRDRALTAKWSSIDLLFQLRGTDLTPTDTTEWLFDPSQAQVDNTIIQSYLFFAIRLEGNDYNRTQLSQITREINKLFMMPVMLLFQHGETLTLSIINRRLHASDPSRDVLEKVTLIKDIDFKDPHRAHIDILFDLALEPLNQTHGVHNFVELHRAWEKTLDTEELNKKFYRELFAWFEWAVAEGKFPHRQKSHPEAGGAYHPLNHAPAVRLVYQREGTNRRCVVHRDANFPLAEGVRSGRRRFLLPRRATEPVFCHAGTPR